MYRFNAGDQWILRQLQCNNVPASMYRRHPPTSLAGGSSTGHSGSSSRQSLQFEGWAKEGLSLGPPSNPSPQLLGGSESNMETDNDGDDDKGKNPDEQTDSEPRFDLTDDLLLKVRLQS